MNARRVSVIMKVACIRLTLKGNDDLRKIIKTHTKAIYEWVVQTMPNL